MLLFKNKQTILQVGISVKEPMTEGFLGWAEESGFIQTAMGGTFGRTEAENSHDHVCRADEDGSRTRGRPEGRL